MVATKPRTNLGNSFLPLTNEVLTGAQTQEILFIYYILFYSFSHSIIQYTLQNQDIYIFFLKTNKSFRRSPSQ